MNYSNGWKLNACSVSMAPSKWKQPRLHRIADRKAAQYRAPGLAHTHICTKTNPSSCQEEKRAIRSEISNESILKMFWRLAIQRRRRIGWMAAPARPRGVKLQKLGSWRRFEMTLAMELAIELASSNLLKGKRRGLASQIRPVVLTNWQSPYPRIR